MNKKILLITAVLIATIAAVGLYFFKGVSLGNEEMVQQKKKKPPRTVSVMKMAPSSIGQTLGLTGSVEPYRLARLASPAEGPVASIRVREGDQVKKGEKLAAIGRKKGLDAEILSLKEELKKEEENLNRTRTLVANQALPGEQLDQARTEYEKVRARLVKAMETAGDYTLCAPWEGVISRVNVKDGEFVAPRAIILEMYDPASLVIRAAVPEAHAAKAAVGMAVRVTIDAFSGDPVPGHISRVYPYLDTELRTRTIEISLNETASGVVSLLPGMFARLDLVLNKDDAALTIPVNALVKTKKGKTVFVFDNGKAVARLVTTGIEQGDRIQITSGVQEGDSVIVEGNEKLKDRTPVRLAGQNQSNGSKNKGNTKIGEKISGEQSGRTKGIAK